MGITKKNIFVPVMEKWNSYGKYRGQGRRRSRGNGWDSTEMLEEVCEAPTLKDKLQIIGRAWPFSWSRDRLDTVKGASRGGW